jgi:hypothetical protein
LHTPIEKSLRIGNREADGFREAYWLRQSQYASFAKGIGNANTLRYSQP